MDPTYYLITTLILSALLAPLCLIKDIRTFKFLGYLVLLLDTSILISLAVLAFVEKPGIVQIEQDFFLMQSPFMYLPDFANLFQVQIYFLWMMQVANEKRRNEEGGKLNMTVGALLFGYVALFSIMGVYGYTGNADPHKEIHSYEFVETILLGTTIGKLFYF